MMQKFHPSTILTLYFIFLWAEFFASPNSLQA